MRWYDDAFEPLYEYYLKFDYAEEPVFLVAALLDPNVGPVVIEALSSNRGGRPSMRRRR